MTKRVYGYTESGTPITDEMIEQLADEAEQGYDIEAIRARRQPGRPRLGSAPSTVESVRLDPDLKQRLIDRAESDGVPVSQVIRDALRRHLEARCLGGDQPGGPMNYSDSQVKDAAAAVGQYRGDDHRAVGAALVVVGLSAERLEREIEIRDNMIRVAHRAGASVRRLAEVSGLGRKAITAIVEEDASAEGL